MTAKILRHHLGRRVHRNGATLGYTTYTIQVIKLYPINKNRN